jgi:hypothetical protein
MYVLSLKWFAYKKFCIHLSYLTSKQLQPIIYYSRLLGLLSPVTDGIFNVRSGTGGDK